MSASSSPRVHSLSLPWKRPELFPPVIARSNGHQGLSYKSPARSSLFPLFFPLKAPPGRTESSSPPCSYRWAPTSYSRSTGASPPLLLRHRARLLALHHPVSSEQPAYFANRRINLPENITAAPLTPAAPNLIYRKLWSTKSTSSSPPFSPLCRRRVHHH
jgi:hypothetical protein